VNLTEDPHRRLNPLTNEWVVVSPHRTKRPWQGDVAPLSALVPPEYDPGCYLCPGNERAGGARNPRYSSTFVFDNDFAALRPGLAPDIPRDRLDPDCRGLIVAEPEPGICRVACFSPKHNRTLATLDVNEIDAVVEMWRQQFRELGSVDFVNYVQIFENRGAMMGASNPHPHCQIWGTYSIPQESSKELVAQRAYSNRSDRCLLCDYVELERREKVRIVAENARFIAVVPFWAMWPFETLICSQTHIGSMNEFTSDDSRQLSAILKQVISTYDKLFSVPFPYSMGFHQSPTDGVDHPEWHFHAHFYPPLLRSATVRKFMVGFEMLGTPQRDITPESAAERLRALAGGQ
jgi:UDPglucose--hexose-1-phosphate uridylyltransferase